MTTIFKWLNDQHWYIIALCIIVGMLFWTYGCESKVLSLLDPDKQVNRSELKVELEYVVGIAGTRVEDLDRQDEMKTALFNALTMISQGGQVNSMGVLNLAATIAAIGWGLKKNQQVNALTTKSPTV